MRGRTQTARTQGFHQVTAFTVDCLFLEITPSNSQFESTAVLTFVRSLRLYELLETPVDSAVHGQ